MQCRIGLVNSLRVSRLNHKPPFFRRQRVVGFQLQFQNVDCSFGWIADSIADPPTKLIKRRMAIDDGVRNISLGSQSFERFPPFSPYQHADTVRDRLDSLLDDAVFELLPHAPML